MKQYDPKHVFIGLVLVLYGLALYATGPNILPTLPHRCSFYIDPNPLVNAFWILTEYIDFGWYLFAMMALILGVWELYYYFHGEENR